MTVSATTPRRDGLSTGFAGLFLLSVLSGQGFVVVHLASSAEVLDAIGATVRSLPVGADEDPTLLTGPDRVTQYQVVAEG